MSILVDGTLTSSGDAALRSMFEARKSVFIDLLKWDLPVLDGRYEIDEFDNEHARYLIIADSAHTHLGSARLLPTERPHILDSHFDALCEEAPPRGPQIWEITRFCLGRQMRALERRAVRNRLVTAIAEHALREGIEKYTGVAEMAWLQQILSFGWDCRPLGLPLPHKSGMLGALEINIAADTPGLLQAGGVWLPTDLQEPATARVAHA